MNDTTRPIPAALVRGLASLRRYSRCQVQRDPEFEASHDRWVLRVRLKVTQTSEFIYEQSDWCFVVDGGYPYGDIAVYPAAGGMSATFPHQERNTPAAPGSSRRNGKLCVDTAFRGERLITVVRDPVGNATERLAWYAVRTVAWLEAAATNSLLAVGDPFEIPARPKPPNARTLEPYRRIVHDESHETFPAWVGTSGYGTATVGTLSELPNVLIVDKFLDGEHALVRQWAGRTLTEAGATSIAAYWWLWPGPVVLPPWEAPETWGELRIVGTHVGVDVDDVLRRITRDVRGITGEVLLLIGYPIPLRVGNVASEVHWEAVLFPKLRGGGKPPDGFRANEVGWWMRDRRGAFSNEATMSYQLSENWSSNRLQARGSLQPQVSAAKTVLVGAGALGSTVSELLTRAGSLDLTLIDGQNITAGNVARHTATLRDVGVPKAAVVSRRLSEISPHNRVVGRTSSLPSATAEVHELLEPFDAVIDCTASADVLGLLGECWWSVPRTFISLSVGFAAQRLFAFSFFGHQFPVDVFDRFMQPWLERESAAWASSGEILEGAGCWSPLFPARCDDIAIAAGVGLKEIERSFMYRQSGPELRVFERVSPASEFQSFVRVA